MAMVTEVKTASFDALVRVVVASSVSNSWNAAVGEWTVIELEEDPAGRGVCICGQTGLVKLFTIRNDQNDSLLFPIGSVCVNQFGRTDLDRQVNLFGDLLTLRNAIRAQEDVTLTSSYFSRAVLDYLYTEGAFTPDQWNRGEGENDYDFLLKMFNKRNKDSLSRPQQWKITMLLQQKVLPFVLADQRLK